MGAVIPLLVDRQLWVRCIARRPGEEGIKILFDGATGGTNRQRGWAECRLHDSRLYRYCDTFQSRLEMAAMLGLGDEAGSLPQCNTRAKHYGWGPDPADSFALSVILELVDY